MDAPNDAERELAKEVSDFALIATWDKAIQKFAEQYKITEGKLTSILDRVAEFNDSADPAGRIDALNDWKKHKETPEHSTPAARGQGKTVT